MNLRNGLRLSLVFFLLFPFLFLFTQFQISSWPDPAELWWAFKNSTLQALFSTVFSLLFGFWVALGLLGTSPKVRTFLEAVCLAPNFLPTLFVLLAVLSVVDPFPMGLAGIALVHTVINFGLAAVLMARAMEERLGAMTELSWVEGASRFLFIRKGLWPLLRGEFALIGLFIFIVCFGSFAVPLVVGGGKGTTIEVLIYEKIRLSHEWGEAVLLAFFQSAFIFFISFAALRGRSPGFLRTSNLSLLRSWSGRGFLFAVSVVGLYGYGQGLVLGFPQAGILWAAKGEILVNFMGSLIVGLGVGILSYLLLLLISFCWPKIWFENFLNGYVAPSTSLACFALLIVSPNEGYFPFVKIPLAITLLSINGLFRMGWRETLQSLEPQVTVAYSMGASHGQIFRHILFPQVASRAGWLAGIAGVWACGDFAVSRILAHRDLSIAMMTETLMSSYRLNLAVVLSLGIVVAGACCFVLIWGGSHVLRRKFTS